MSTFTVTNIADSGAGSLRRHEIGQANSQMPTPTRLILTSAVFNSALTINLTQRPSWS